MRLGVFSLLVLATACSGAGAREPMVTDAGPPDECLDTSEAEIDLRVGSVIGRRTGGTCGFLGIPYGRSGDPTLRWRRAPMATVPDGYEAFSTGPPCPQLVRDGWIGDEDCLRLNLWVPRRTEEPKPVLVFFHGGGNVSGTASDPRFDGAALAERADAIVVTANFRLGPLAYLAHPALTAEGPGSGNYGLLDQLTVLEWIRQNVTRFDGDPSRVVGVGQSAGARNLCALVASPLARGLLSGAVLQSGACNYRTLERAEEDGLAFAESVGCGTAPSVTQCLRALDVGTILRALPGIPNPLIVSEWNPNVDGWALVDEPLEWLRRGDPDLPLIVGTNAEEVGQVMPILEGDDDYRAVLRLYFGPDLADRIALAYPPGDHPTPRHALVAAVTDARYTCPLNQTARSAAGGHHPAYRYSFERRLEDRPDDGAYHGLELAFLFRTFEASGITPTSDDLALSDRMIEYYAAFAHTGRVDGVTTGPTWVPFTEEREAYLVLDAPVRSATGLRSSACDFWDRLMNP